MVVIVLKYNSMYEVQLPEITDQSYYLWDPTKISQTTCRFPDHTCLPDFTAIHSNFRLKLFCGLSLRLFL